MSSSNDNVQISIRRLVLLIVSSAVFCSPLVRSQIVFENARGKLILGDDARVVSLVDKHTSRECQSSVQHPPIAYVTVGGKPFQACSAKQIDGGVELGFKGVDTIARYEVKAGPDWLLFRLVEIRGARPSTMMLLRVAPAITETVGTKLNAAYDDETVVCMMAASRQPDCGARGGGKPELRSVIQDAPGPAMEGAAVALIVCAKSDFKAVARKLAHETGLLTNETADGVPVKDTEFVRGSYFFISFGEDEAETMIRYCEDAGIHQVMLSSGAWCQSVGHYLFNERRYPNGLDGLKHVVQKLHERGILVGMHCFASKISKRDPFVNPIPDKRFWRRFETTLAGAVAVDAAEIQVAGDLRDWAGSSHSANKYWEGGIEKHREAVIGNEIVQYESIGPEGRWDTFFGCRRGAWGTTASVHSAGEAVVHYGVDGCINGYIIDQETGLLDEAQSILADVFNECEFDMVYFDGGEDVDRSRFKYYVSNFQEKAMRRFRKRPIIHMGTIMTHRLWHSFARSSTVDTYLNTLSGAIVGGKPPENWPTVRGHINRSVKYMLRMKADMMPGELGWFGIWPRRTFHGREVEGLQLDEAEYLMCKSLGYDAPVSLQTGFDSMERHPLTPEILRIVKAYETLRLSGDADADTLVRLQKLDHDFAMVIWDGRRSFVPVTPLGSVAGEPAFRGCSGAFGNGSLATLWHVAREARLTLDMSDPELAAVDLSGKRVPLRRDKEGRAVIPIDQRRLALVAPSTPCEQLEAALSGATPWVKPPAVLTIKADECVSMSGKVALGSTVGISEPVVGGDVLIGTAQADFTAVNPAYAEYRVDIPHEGIWYVWAYVRYPSGTDQSFALVRKGEAATMKGDQILGNCGKNDKKWHWTGRGGGSSAVPPGRCISFKLNKGPFVFRIHPRECGANPVGNPRLARIVLIDEEILPGHAEFEKYVGTPKDAP